MSIELGIIYALKNTKILVGELMKELTNNREYFEGIVSL